MERIRGEALVLLGKLVAGGKLTHVFGKIIEPTAAVENWLAEMSAGMTKAGLRVSARLVDDLSAKLKGRRLLDTELRQGLLDLESRIDHEIGTILFLWMPPHRSRFFLGRGGEGSDVVLFAERIESRFPEAQYDIERAGKCYALGQNTACVFHLGRVMEVGLEALKGELGIRKWHPTWNAAVFQIKSKVKARSGKKKVTTAQRHRNEFVESAAGWVQSVAFAWRNKAIHRPKVRYEEDEALEVYNAVKAFMGHMEKALRKNRRGVGTNAI